MTQSGSNKFVLDGFPKAIDQVQDWEHAMGNPSAVFYFDTPEQPEMDETEMRKRQVFENQTGPVIDKYARDGRVRTFNTGLLSVDQISEQVEQLLRPDVVCVLGNGS